MKRQLQFVAMILCLLIGANLVAATDNHPWISPQGTTPTHTIHWMPNYNYNARECLVPVNPYSTRVVNGITGIKSNGETICFVPHRRHRHDLITEE